MRVLIADDHPIFRAGLKEILAKDSEVKSIEEAENGHKAVELARKQPYDLAIIDITMPEKGGLEVLQELRRDRPKLPVLILSAHPEDQLAEAAKLGRALSRAIQATDLGYFPASTGIAKRSSNSILAMKAMSAKLKSPAK